MPQCRDITGQVFGRLTALHVIGKSKARREAIWLCVCTCGNEKSIQLGSLRTGDTKSCGCLQKEVRPTIRAININGIRSGKLVAIRSTTKRFRGCVLWECQCDCGKTKEVTSYNIKSGHVISCGCARLKRNAIRKKNIRERKLNTQNKRRAQQLKSEGSFTPDEIKVLYLKQHGKCAICFKRVDYENIRRDHIIPLARDGANRIDNIQILCNPCNVRKSSKDPIAYARQIGRLL